MISHSIRWNLQLWLAFLLVLLLTGFCLSMYHLERIERFRQIDEELDRHLSALRNEVIHYSGEFGRRRLGPFEEKRNRDSSNEPSGPRFGERDEMGEPNQPDTAMSLVLDIHLTSALSRMFDETRPDGHYYAIWLPGRTLLVSSSNCPVNLKLPKLEKDLLSHFRSADNSRVEYFFTSVGECVLVGRNVSSDLRDMAYLRWGLFVAGGLILALGLGGGWWLTTRALRPVEEISASASRISEGNLSERIKTSVPGNEIGRLADVLNSMFSRLESAFLRQKQFTADASHELRTPLAVIISEAQTTLARPRTPEEYRETIEVCLESAQQMRKLADSLLELARFDAGQQELVMGEFDLSMVVRERLDLVRLLAQDKHIEIQDSLTPVMALGDGDRIGQVVTNLLINAMQYGGSPGTIEVKTSVESGWAVLIVHDSGPGITVEDLPHIFERFYRADKARARAHGNHGLGLAICKTIMDAHHGSIVAQSLPGQGATFIVKLPVITGRCFQNHTTAPKQD